MADAIRDRVRRHFEAIGKDEALAAEIYTEDAVLEYIQSGERIHGKANIVASRQAYRGRPAAFELEEARGCEDFMAAELTLRFGDEDPHPVVALLTFRDGMLAYERLYIAEPWEAPTYRAPWVT